jgi:biopolymer transport protein ExbB
MIDRALSYWKARKQSLEFAPAVAGCLKEGKIDEAISVAEQNKNSHLAKVVEAGLQEYRSQGDSTELSGEQIESSLRACERAESIVNAELKRGLSSLATIGATAPFVGLFGTTVGIINAFQAMSSEQASGLAAVAGGISEALVATAFGLFVAVPAVWAYNAFTNRVESFQIEMTNSASELMDYFIKRRGGK